MGEKTSKLNAQLADIQHELKVGKDAYNAFSKYNYRNAETILTALKPLLAKAKLTLNLTEEVEMIGARFYVKSTATLTDGDEVVQATAYAREEETKKGMDASQITGSATSYARKYALGGLFAIDDGNDADGQDNTKHNAQPYSKPRTATAPAKTTQAPKPIETVYTAEQRQQINDLAKRLGFTDEIVEAKLSTIKTPKDAEIMIDKLNALVGMENTDGTN